jgi:hypothetical protein
VFGSASALKRDVFGSQKGSGNQEKEENKMKTNMIRMFLALGAACVSGSVLNAQTYTLVANVPFEFQVGNKVFAEGKYTVGSYGMGDMQTVLSTPKGERIFIAGAYPKLDSVRPGRLVFHCYGNECFLAEIWPVDGKGRLVPASHAETAIRRDAQLAMAMRTVDVRRAD